MAVKKDFRRPASSLVKKSRLKDEDLKPLVADEEVVPAVKQPAKVEAPQDERALEPQATAHAPEPASEPAPESNPEPAPAHEVTDPQPSGGAENDKRRTLTIRMGDDLTALLYGKARDHNLTFTAYCLLAALILYRSYKDEISSAIHLPREFKETGGKSPSKPMRISERFDAEVLTPLSRHMFGKKSGALKAAALWLSMKGDDMARLLIRDASTIDAEMGYKLTREAKR